MTWTRRPPPLSTNQASPTVSGPRWLAAIGAALAIQVAAAMTALLAGAIFLVAALENWGNNGDEGIPAYVLLSIPIGAAAPGVFAVSGVAASRIIGDNRGWWLLIFGPATWALISGFAGAF
jgi:ABC-type spermidine/putrescine transport system permease subunit II